ncbi:hypothetical protein Fot_11401 [Forsythia ovata]|uniref:Uncharacterized protein n=1 Tax=Forsythia ovata TaxID=205694 RepID=A0ABD1WJK6_9LAMI
MAGFYFSKIPVFKIRGAGVVDGQETLPPQLLVPCTTPVPVATVPLVPEVAVDVSSTIPLEESPLPSENVRRPDKRKRVANDEGEKTIPKRATEDEDDAEDTWRAK